MKFQSNGRIVYVFCSAVTYLIVRRVWQGLTFGLALAWSMIGFVVDGVGDEPLNVLIIQTDEHNFRTLGCYRDTLPRELGEAWGPGVVVETPAIDSIADAGVTCTSFYATSPVCTPSRASFFTGRYPQHTGAAKNNLPLSDSATTFAEILRRQGYATGYAGKWHLDGNGKPQWSPKRQFGFSDNRFMFNRGHWKKLAIAPDGPIVAARDDRGRPSYGLAGADRTSYATDWLCDRACEFIRDHANEPFCYHLSLPDPHGPNNVRPPYDEMFDELPIRPPMTFRMTRENPAWAVVDQTNFIKTFQPGLMAKYFGMVRLIDDNVGKLLATLDRHGVRDRTVVVFTSDHGDLCFEHGRLNKGNPYEGSAKIPMIISAPGRLPHGARVNMAMGTVDFAPTVLGVLRVETDTNFQGQDYSSVLRSNMDEDDTTTIIRSAGGNWIAAISDRFKLIYSNQEEPFLFDLEADPNELNNAFEQVANRAVVRAMTGELMAYRDRIGDPILNDQTIRSQMQATIAATE